MRSLILLVACTLSCLAQPFSPNDPAFLQSTSPLRRGLVGYWRLEESSGTRDDCSQNGNHLTDNNSVSQVAGIQTYGAGFVSTSSQFLSHSSTPSLQGGNIDYSVAAWFWLTNYPPIAGRYMIVSKDDDIAGTREYNLNVWNNAGLVVLQFDCFSSPDTDVAVETTSTPPTNQWVFVIAWNDTTAKSVNIQMNNGETRTTTYVGSLQVASTAQFEIGARQYTGFENYFDGKIDEVSMWKRLLTAAEMTQLYRSGLGTHFPWAHP